MSSPAEKLTQGVASAKRRRPRWWQFSLRGLLIAIVVCSLFFAWIGGDVRRAVRQKRAIELLRSLNANVQCFEVSTAILPRLIGRVLGRESITKHHNVIWNTASLPVSALSKHDVALLSELASLELLEMSGPQVTDETVSWIARLPELQYLHLTDSPRLTNHGIQHLLPLAGRLEWLELRSTLVDDELTSFLLKFPQLAVLELTDTRVTGKSLRQLLSLPNLAILHLDEVADADLEPLSDLGQLNSFVFDGRQMTSHGLSKLKSIAPKHNWFVGGDHVGSWFIGGEIVVHHRRLSDADLPAILSAEDKRLFVADSDVTDRGLEFIARHPSLVSIVLDGSQITDGGLAHLQQLTKLQDLSVARTQVTVQGILQLRLHPKLRSIDIRDTPITAQGLAELVSALPHIDLVGGH